MPRPSRLADCHPERPHKALGKCKQCYNLQRNRDYHTKNAEVISAKRKEDRLVNKSKYAGYRVASKYGMTLDDVKAMLALQGDCCMICGTRIDMTTKHIDHNHLTGSVRGLLCGECNIGLGKFKDDVTVLLKAADYLRTASTRFGSKPVKQ